MSNHLPEWKRIKSEYQEKEQTNEIKFRISCIESLIESAENRIKEMNHFR